MFDSITLHGSRAALLWGYRTAAVLTSWRIVKTDKGWVLTGTLERADAFQCRQKPLLFTAPRDRGQWCWPLRELHLGTNSLRATLGPPEQ